jgi:hypothetical protein
MSISFSEPKEQGVKNHHEAQWNHIPPWQPAPAAVKSKQDSAGVRVVGLYACSHWGAEPHIEDINGVKMFEWLKSDQKLFSTCLDYWVNMRIRGKWAIRLEERKESQRLLAFPSEFISPYLSASCAFIVSGPRLVQLQEFNFILLDIIISTGPFSGAESSAHSEIF